MALRTIEKDYRSLAVTHWLHITINSIPYLRPYLVWLSNRPGLFDFYRAKTMIRQIEASDSEIKAWAYCKFLELLENLDTKYDLLER